MSRLRKILAGRSGEGHIDVAVSILCVILVLALSVRILPAFIAKQQLDVPAAELRREAEIAGRIGSETNRRAVVLREKTGLNLEIHWSVSGQTQLNEEVTVQLTYRYNLGLSKGFSPFLITLRAATTRGFEMHWK